MKLKASLLLSVPLRIHPLIFIIEVLHLVTPSVVSTALP